MNINENTVFTSEEEETFILESSHELIEAYLGRDKVKRFNKIKNMSEKSKEKLDKLVTKNIDRHLDAMKKLFQDNLND